MSFLGVIPLVGDAAKAGKLGKYVQSVDKALRLVISKPASRFAKLVKPLLEVLCKGLTALPLHRLPDNVGKPLSALRDRLVKGLGGCFAAGTPLLTPDGSKSIEDFRPGDMILSAPEHDPHATPVPKRVEEVFERYSPLLELGIGSAAIKTTAEHPFWVEGRGWTPADQLVEGDRLRARDGSTVVLSRLEWLPEAAPVYNMRVADYHTYFVGSADWGFSVWAHNSYNGNSISNAVQDIQRFDFGALLRRLKGDPPAGMINPHAHHVLFKKGLGPAQQKLVEEGQEILRKHGIDPVFGPENLYWAPNAVTGQHGIEAVKNVVDALKKVDANGGGYDDMVKTLKELSEIAASRR